MTAVHYVCCDKNWSLCDEDVSGEESHDALNEGEELCLTCLKRDNVDAPCRSPLCPLRPRFERFLYLWRIRGEHRRAVGQLLSWRKP